MVPVHSCNLHTKSKIGQKWAISGCSNFSSILVAKHVGPTSRTWNIIYGPGHHDMPNLGCPYLNKLKSIILQCCWPNHRPLCIIVLHCVRLGHTALLDMRACFMDRLFRAKCAIWMFRAYFTVGPVDRIMSFNMLLCVSLYRVQYIFRQATLYSVLWQRSSN
jgi:hypothetical protein